MFSVLKKIFRIIEVTLGVVIPCTTFIIMFVAFCLQIFSRYVLNYQFEWTYEFTVIGFIWTVVFGAIYASKQNEHVSFSLIYDKFGPKGRSIITLIGDVIILGAFCLMFIPTVEYVDFIRIKTSPVLKVPFDIIYAPFVLFIIFSGGYLVRDMIKAIKTLRMSKEQLKEIEEKRKEEMFLVGSPLSGKEESDKDNNIAQKGAK